MTTLRTLVSSLSLALAFVTTATGAFAQAAPTASPVTVQGGPGQDTLWVEYTSKAISTRACAGPCGSGGESLVMSDVPTEVLASAGSAKTTVIALENGRRILRLDVEVPVKDAPSSLWTALFAAPLASAKQSQATVLWSGWLGKKGGLEGEEVMNVLRVEPLAKGNRVVLGEQRESLTICGRPAVVAARAVDPQTLSWSKSAMVDSLSDDEKKKAEKVVAVRETGTLPAPTVRLLRANAASSALEKRIDSLTDGSTELGWTEAKIGDGRGEWVRMAASNDVGIVGLSVQIRPTAVEVPDGAAPSTLYFATDTKLYQLDLPDSAWGDRDARYEVKLPAELKTSCLAVVVGGAHSAKNVANPRVTIAEITARTALDSLSLEALANSLGQGGDKARAAAAMLAKGDSKGIAAIASAWTKLDGAGQSLAMEVVDGAACTEQAPFYAERLTQLADKKLSGPSADPVAAHARDRLRRCGRASAPALGKLIKEAPDAVRIVAAEEMAVVAPAETVTAIVSVLPKLNDAVRRELRGSLAKAAGSAKARTTVTEHLQNERFSTFDEVVKIDLLRAVGPALPDIENGKQALFGLLSKQASFRARYLLLAPTADLASKGDAESITFVREALLKDVDKHVRTRAAEVSAKVPSLSADLVTAAADSEPRVREAALHALGQSANQGNKLPTTAEPVLAASLSKDGWTFVRIAAADALSVSPKSDSVDKALADALLDVSPEVRGRALDGLGVHKARTYAAAVRERAQIPEETLDVRVRALLALGAMCDRESVDYLTKMALGAASQTSEVERRLGAAALTALGEIHPSDLAKRIEKLTSKESPILVREMAKSALSATTTCESK
ncbi:MAG: hypothetical protein IPK82_21365 [Polyangiaceae bacterium]|nr:hypothetical protein [Polyangiaceae bacterium]